MDNKQDLAYLLSQEGGREIGVFSPWYPASAG